jgi:hypothetical protein
VATLALLLAGSLDTLVQAQTPIRYFAPTGHSVEGLFLQYWDGHGGLAQQGYPITQPFDEKSDLNGQTYQVQYFERAVFEKHPENQPPYDVLLSQLGTFEYRRKYQNGAPDQHVSTEANAVKFPETGFTVGGKFLDYWKGHGGLAQQGFPISNEFQEKSDLNGQTYTVQYFERAVFELHPENQPPYDVLLSQLGTFQLRRKYANGVPGGADATVTPPPVQATPVPGTAGPQPTLPPVGTPVPGALTVREMLAKSDAAMNALTSMKHHEENTVTDASGAKTQDVGDYVYAAPDREAGRVVSPRADGTHITDFIFIGTTSYTRSDNGQWQAQPAAFHWPQYNNSSAFNDAIDVSFQGRVSLNGVPTQIVRVSLPLKVGTTTYVDQMTDYYISLTDYRVLRQVLTIPVLPAANRTYSVLKTSDFSAFNEPTRIGPPGEFSGP